MDVIQTNDQITITLNMDEAQCVVDLLGHEETPPIVEAMIKSYFSQSYARDCESVVFEMYDRVYTALHPEEDDDV